MAPRSGKRRRRVKNPLPVWLPLPRPCLRSLNMPGSPYFMPLSPEMYLPPWTLPHSFFTKPMCHCANEDFCTSKNCRNSEECLKTHPMFCPHMHNETSKLSENTVREQQQNIDDQETSSSSDINICSACGAPSSKQRTLNKNKKLTHHNPPKPCPTSKGIRTQDSCTSSHNLEQNNQDAYSEIKSTGRSLVSRGNLTNTEIEHSSPDIILSKKDNGCVNGSCQTSLSNSRTRGHSRPSTQKKNHRNPMESTSNYAENSENLFNRNASAPSDTYKKVNHDMKDEFGCSSCAQHENSPVKDLETNQSDDNVMNKELSGATNKLATDNLHVDQLPNQLSNARKRQANKYSGCCFTGSEKKCKTAIEIDTMSNNNIIKPDKKSKCGCYSNNTSSKASTRARKLSDCICSSTKISFAKTSRFHNSLTPNKKQSAKLQKLSQCECPSTKITQISNSRKLSECSCPSTDADLRDNNFSAHKCSIACSSTKLTSKVSNKSIKDITSSNSTNVKQSSCQCKFPPAYEHLSCTGNLGDNCSCGNNV